MGFCSRVRAREAPIRGRVARCHLYLQFSSLHSVDNVDKFQRLCKPNPAEELAVQQIIDHRSDQNEKVSSCSLPNDKHPKEKEQVCNDEDAEEIRQILSSSDDWGSIQLALEMRSVHFGPSLVEAILKRCKRNSRAALQFFSWVQRLSYYMPTTGTYNTAMKLAGSAKDFKHMWYLYKEMLRSGCSPTVDTWNVMVCQYGNADLSEKALQTFYAMKQDGFLPDKSTYNHLIMYLTDSKGRKVDDAVKIFQEMCHAGHTIDKSVLFMYLSALCECRKIADARRSVARLCGQGFSAQVAYSIFLRSLCRADQLEEALLLFDDIEKHGCSRDQYIYGTLIHAFLRRNQFEDAVAKLTEMKNVGIPQNTYIYTSFIVYYFQKRDASEALNVLKEMKKNGCEPTVVTYSALIRGHMTMGMVSEAWGVFHQMKHKGPAPDFETYSMFMACLCKSGRSEDGLQLIHDMLDCGFIPSTKNFTTVVHGLNMEGKHELAQSALRSKWDLQRQRTISK
jgi:pentatricopeptide repeat protein